MIDAMPVRRPNGSPRDWMLVVGQFVVLAAVCSVVWAFLMNSIGGQLAWTHGFPTSINDKDAIQESAAYFIVTAGSVVPAAAIHLYTPDEYVDRFHRLGALFALFIPINLTLSLLFILGSFFNGTTPLSADYIVILFVFSSLFLPGPYAGALLASRYSIVEVTSLE